MINAMDWEASHDLEEADEERLATLQQFLHAVETTDEIRKELLSTKVHTEILPAVQLANLSATMWLLRTMD